MEAPGGGVDVARLESLASGGEKEKQDALAAGEKVRTAIPYLGSTIDRAPLGSLSYLQELEIGVERVHVDLKGNEDIHNQGGILVILVVSWREWRGECCVAACSQAQSKQCKGNKNVTLNFSNLACCLPKSFTGVYL